MTSLPIEILGKIGSYLYKEDHQRLSQCNISIYQTISSYSSSIILTKFQEDLYNELIQYFILQNITRLRIASMPHSRTRFPLAYFITLYIVKFPQGQVVIVDKDKNLKKWEIILCNMLKTICERDDISISRLKQNIVLTPNFNYWNYSPNENPDDLLINLIKRLWLLQTLKNYYLLSLWYSSFRIYFPFYYKTLYFPTSFMSSNSYYTS